MEGRNAILISDIFSAFYTGKHPRQYGRKGERVTIVSDRGEVQIVQKTDGGRFPVNKKSLLIQ